MRFELPSLDYLQIRMPSFRHEHGMCFPNKHRSTSKMLPHSCILASHSLALFLRVCSVLQIHDWTQRRVAQGSCAKLCQVTNVHLSRNPYSPRSVVNTWIGVALNSTAASCFIWDQNKRVEEKKKTNARSTSVSLTREISLTKGMIVS